MKNKTSIFLLPLLFSACSIWHRPLSSDVVMECNGHILTETELQTASLGKHGADSVLAVQAHIEQWAVQILEYEAAKSFLNEEIERMVEEYRRMLAIQAYEQHRIRQHMSTNVDDTLVEAFYQTHNKYFILREPIVKGILLIIPNDAPHIDNARRFLTHYDEENLLEIIEKYAYQYATGYELFTEQWVTSGQLLMHMPFEKDDLASQLRTKKQIEMKDSINTYMLHVTDWCATGTAMPIEYARPQIEQMILTQRQASFIKQERKELYHQAMISGKIKSKEQHNILL